MSDVVVLVAEARPGVGKGAARQTRREGYVPAVIYGAKKEPVTIRLQGNALLKTLHKGGFFTTIFEIQVGGDSHHAIPKAIQKDKLNGLPTHVDFLRVERGALIEVEVPVHFENHEASPGLKAGGSLNVARHVVELRVPNNAIPDSLTVDLRRRAHQQGGSASGRLDGHRPRLHRRLHRSAGRGRGGRRRGRSRSLRPCAFGHRLSSAPSPPPERASSCSGSPFHVAARGPWQSGAGI